MTAIKVDWQKIGKGALIAMGGALLTYLSAVITDIDFGTWTPAVTAFWSIIVNLGRVWLQSNNE